MKNNRLIRLTEQDLHYIVEDVVRQCITENETDELFGGLRALGGGYKQRMQQQYNNAKDLWKAGSMNSNIQKQVKNVMNALGNLEKAANGIDPNLSALVSNIEQKLQQGVQASAQTNLDNARNQFVNRGYNYQNNNPSFTVGYGDGNGGYNQVG